jgi:hypothetical protein
MPVMKKLITIPNNLDILENEDEFSIDMSDLKFDCPDNKKKFYAFIFIRNTGIKDNLNFENCSFEDKEEYLMMFLTYNIEVKCSLLASTWIEILSFGTTELCLPSILSKVEIEKFINRNREFVDNVHRFINSLPIYSIYTFNNSTNSNMDISEFKSTDNDDIKLANFYQLTEIDSFILLLTHAPLYEHRPVFYTRIFSNRENSYEFVRIMKNLPFINILNAMFSSTECQNDILDNINTYLEKEE